MGEGVGAFAFVAPKDFFFYYYLYYNCLAFKSFDFYRTWWIVFQKRVMPTKYLRFYSTFDEMFDTNERLLGINGSCGKQDFCIVNSKGN